jgi:hypothetical protein
MLILGNSSKLLMSIYNTTINNFINFDKNIFYLLFLTVIKFYLNKIQIL